MKRFFVFCAFSVISTNAFAAACFISIPVANYKTCSEYSGNAEIVSSQKQLCAAQNGKWVSDCTASIGCEIKNQALNITTTTWYVNGESSATVQAGCKLVNGTYVTK